MPGRAASPSKVDSDGDDIPGPALPRTNGRSSATALVRAGDRPVSAPGAPGRRGRGAAAERACRREGVEASADRFGLLLVDLGLDSDDAGEEEESETERQEGVT